MYSAFFLPEMLSCAYARVSRLDEHRQGKNRHNSFENDMVSHGKGNSMRAPRDFCQRKVYGVIRVSLAMNRLSKAETQAERQKASDWLVAWISFGGLRRLRQTEMVSKEETHNTARKQIASLRMTDCKHVLVTSAPPAFRTSKNLHRISGLGRNFPFAEPPRLLACESGSLD